MNTSLTELIWLAHDLRTIRDDRPEWLRSMPSANDEGQTQYARYYRFFYEFVKRCGPESVLEIGTYLGTSAAHLAYSSPSCRVVTMDIEVNPSVIVNEIAARRELKNLTAVTGDSAKIFADVAKLGMFDVLFIDAVHDFEHCYSEYLLYRPMVKHGGIIFFDDIHISREMDAAWECIADPKADLLELHYTGFGACKVDASVTPRSLEDAKTAVLAKLTK